LSIQPHHLCELTVHKSGGVLSTVSSTRSWCPQATHVFSFTHQFIVFPHPALFPFPSYHSRCQLFSTSSIRPRKLHTGNGFGGYNKTAMHSMLNGAYGRCTANTPLRTCNAPNTSVNHCCSPTLCPRARRDKLNLAADGRKN
jgi:hypothetical protein